MMIMTANQTNAEFCYLAGRYPGSMGHLYSPGAARGPMPFFPYALDNGAYGAWEKNLPWDEAAWRGLLAWAAASGQSPLWSLVPDVVCDRDRTIESWHAHIATVRSHGFRPAFAIQDDMTFDDVPTDDCVIFVGGSTKWKEDAIEPWAERFPGRVHVGRVNKTARLNKCHAAGVVSIDGTGWWHHKQKRELVDFLCRTKGGQSSDVLLSARAA